MTLVYLGDANAIDPDRLHELVARLKRVAYDTPPVKGTLTGYGRFREYDNDEDVLWVGLDSPDLPELRHRVLQACTDAGLEPAGDRGFTPHVTLAYVEPGEGEDSMPNPTEVEIKYLSVVIAGTETMLRLTGDEHDAADKRPQAPLSQRTFSLLQRSDSGDMVSLVTLEEWAQRKGDLLVRPTLDARRCVVVKKGADVAVGVEGWGAPVRLDDLVVAMRRIAHDYLIEGWLGAKDLDGMWVSVQDLGRVLTADTIATPVFFPKDLLVLDGDLSSRSAHERWELLRALVPEAGGHVVVPPQILCQADQELEADVDRALAWRPSEGAGLALLGVEVVQADSPYVHGPSAAVATLALRTELARKYSAEGLSVDKAGPPDEARDDHGRWTSAGGWLTLDGRDIPVGDTGESVNHAVVAERDLGIAPGVDSTDRAVDAGNVRYRATADALVIELNSTHAGAVRNTLRLLGRYRHMGTILLSDSYERHDSACACSGQKRMSISRYIAVAVVRCAGPVPISSDRSRASSPRGFWRVPLSFTCRLRRRRPLICL